MLVLKTMVIPTLVLLLDLAKDCTHQGWTTEIQGCWSAVFAMVIHAL